MIETKQQRVSRLQTRKQELLGQIEKLKAKSTQHVRYRVVGLEAQVEAITRAIKKLKRKGGKSK